MGNLVILSQIRVKIGFSREHQLRGKGAFQGKSQLYSILNGLFIDNWLTPRMAEADWTDTRIRVLIPLRWAGTKQLCFCIQLGMNFEANYHISRKCHLSHYHQSPGRISSKRAPQPDSQPSHYHTQDISGAFYLSPYPPGVKRGLFL